MNDVLNEKWNNLRGMQIVSFGVSSVKASEEDEQMLKELQRNAAFTDPNRAAAHLVGAQAAAMQAAASNQNAGATAAFMGMGMAGAMGGFGGGFGDMSGAGRPWTSKRQAEPDEESWTCECGHSNSGKFCAECGKQKPRPAGSWICDVCGVTNTTTFCGSCGRMKPSPDGWSCTACGIKNKGRFCSNCGKPKPAATLLYKCDKCGWEPEDPYNPPKFCPECGDPFDEQDVQNKE